MAVSLPREGRYLPRAMVNDWEEARRRLEAEPGEWVLPLDGQVSSGIVSWLRRSGPIALADIREEVEYRLRDSTQLTKPRSRVGTLYARYTPGETAPEYVSGVMTDEQVVQARQAYATGEVTQRALAEQYGISPVGMHMILTGKSRLSAGGPIYRKEQS